MVSMIYADTTELMDALGEAHRQRPGSASWVKAAQRVFWTALDRLAISQNAAAKAAGISSGYLSALVQGNTGAGRKTAAKLAEVVGLCHNELFVREVV